MKLLVTRPEPDGARSAEALRARGHRVVLAPLTRIAPLKSDLGAGPWGALLITSANAVRALENHPQRQRLSGLPVLTVGDRSAAAAREAGFADVTSAGGAANELVSLAKSHCGGNGHRLLWLAGAERAGDIVAPLAAAGLRVELRVIYQAVADIGLPAEAVHALRGGSLDGVLHFSRRGSEAYLSATAKVGLAETGLWPAHFCLSERVAEPLTAAGAARVRISPQPTEEALLNLLDEA